jgi:hypothetical protein
MSVKAWKRRIARVVRAKKPPTPRKRKGLSTVVIPPKPPKVKPPTHAEAKSLLAEHGKAVSAPTLAPESATPAARAYKELDAVTKKLTSPTPTKRPPNRKSPLGEG